MSNYAQIRSIDISNGTGVGVSIFFSGCDFHCQECFNKELWDYEYGNVFTNETINTILELMNRPQITRLSILGGESLADRNVFATYQLCEKVKKIYPNKKIWLYTGYKFETICDNFGSVQTDDFTIEKSLRHSILQYIDVLVDGQYVHQQRDITLAFRGSSNQRLIDVQKTLQKQEIVLYEE